MSNTVEKPKIIVIVGPTASGKTALSIELARRFDGEIISADSRQVYRGMDIGTGKVTRREMRGIPHYLLDVASPSRTFTASHYQKLAKKALKKILTKKKIPIVIGGTGFYIDSLIYDYTLPSIKPNPALRRSLEKRSAEDLFRELVKRDPRRAESIDRNNKRRLVRALEIVLLTKKPVPSREASLARTMKYDALMLGLAPKPDALKKNIARRLAKRLRRGMVREVEHLHKNGLSFHRLDGFGLEYRYVSRYLRSMISRNEMVAAIERESWLYAKRQMTWFKQNNHIHWIEGRKANALVKKFLSK